MSPKKIVIIGGSAAGAKAAAKARRLDQKAEITLIQKDPDLSMASCGYPYYVGGVFNDRNMLLSTPTGVVRDPQFFHKTKNITAHTQTEVTAIDRSAKKVSCTDLITCKHWQQEYDKLIICTGASAILPPVPGIELKGIRTLLSMADTDYLREIRDEKKSSKAVIIGGGLIGVEACEALQQSGLNVTLIEMAPTILPFLDSQLAKIAENHISSKGVEVITNNGVQSFLGEAGKLSAVKLKDDTIIYCETALIATGVTPNMQLAQKAGLKIGTLGGIVVNDHLVTSDADIYAAGDCIEVQNIITGNNVLAPMGDLANLQGRVAGENIVNGNSVVFPGTIQTCICKIFDFSAGATGLTETSAHRNAISDIEMVINASPDKPGFMGSGLLISKLIVEKTTKRILGYQCIGSGDVSRQIATAAMAIQGGLTLNNLACADLPYAPPFSLAIDHFIASVHIMGNKLAGNLKSISAEEVFEKVSAKKNIFLLDARGPDEYETLQLGIGETYIPLGALRSRLTELPEDKDTEIICFCKISLRGYETALILEDNGWTNVKVMEGGIMAWPYAREI